MNYHIYVAHGHGNTRADAFASDSPFTGPSIRGERING
jgi:hypothetical protein